MTHEIEPVPPGNEYNTDESDMLKQVWVVEGLIVSKDDQSTRYIVTNILSGGEIIHDRFYPRLLSTQMDFILSPEKLTDYSYRALVSESNYRSVEEDDYNLDTLHANDTSIQVGDRVRITRWEQMIPIEGGVPGAVPGTSFSIESIDAVSVLESGIDIRNEERSVLKRKRYIRKNLAAILYKLEQLQLAQRDRLQTDAGSPITWSRNTRNETWRAEYVYGEGEIHDHFVDLKAKLYFPTNDVPLGGDMRYTMNGNAFLTRDITVSETSKELVHVNEPLVELSARVWTEMVVNPDVNNIRVDFIVDGTRYSGVRDFDESSHSYEKPGQHISFNSFSVPNAEYDGIQISPDELEAIGSYRDVLHRLTMRAIYAGIDAKIARKQLGDDSTSSEISVLKQQQRALELAGESAFQNLQPTIDQIKTRPSDIKLGLGGRLLVPPSKLADVRVIISDVRNNELRP